jgi:hypothetical protein
VVVTPVVGSPMTVVATHVVSSFMHKLMKKRNLVYRNLFLLMRKSNINFLCMMCHMMDLLEDLIGPEFWLSLMTMRYMLANKFRWRVILPHLKKP